MTEDFTIEETDAWDVRTLWRDAPGGTVIAAHTFDEEPLPGAGIQRFLSGSGGFNPSHFPKLVGSQLSKNLGVDIQGRFLVSSFQGTFGDLNEVLSDWARMSDVNLSVVDVRRLQQIPIPSFGSPPSAWSALGGKVVGGGTIAVLTGYAAQLGHPLLIVLEAGVLTLIWFVKPTAKVARRALAERVAVSLGTTMKETDE